MFINISSPVLSLMLFVNVFDNNCTVGANSELYSNKVKIHLPNIEKENFTKIIITNMVINSLKSFETNAVINIPYATIKCIKDTNKLTSIFIQ